MPGVLDGVRVLEWGAWVAAPSATMMLADLGAEVIKLERPVTGDPMRGLTPVMGRDVLLPKAIGSGGLSFHVVNRNKKSIAVDVSKESGRALIYELIRSCDVFLQNYRQGIAAKVGLDYATLSQHNPRLVYVNITGYGPKGPASVRRAQDSAGMARSGLASAVWGSDDRDLPELAGGMVDQVAAMMAAYGVTSALVGRDRQGIGQEVDVSLLGSSICLQNLRFGYTLLLNEELPKHKRNEHPSPLYNRYRCADGKWLAFAVVASDRVWVDFCRACELTHLVDDPRFSDIELRRENRRELIAILDETFAAKTRGEWLAILKEHPRVMVSPVLEPLEVAEDVQTKVNDYVIEIEHPEIGRHRGVGFPVTFSKTPAAIRRPTPALGADTEQVLMDLAGCDQDRIKALREAFVIQ